METNGRIEDVKKAGKRMKKACPVELKLAHAHTGLARALGFKDWHDWSSRLQKPFTAEFGRRVTKVSSDPSHPTFLAAVTRFSESSGVSLTVAHALCVEFLPTALEKWQTWRERAIDPDNAERETEQHRPPTSETEAVPSLAWDDGIPPIAQKAPVCVVVRKRRRVVEPDR